MSNDHCLSASAYRITKLKLEPPGPDGEMVGAELDGVIWVRMSRTELCDLELFQLAVEQQAKANLPRPIGNLAAFWREQMEELLFEADHLN